MKQKFTYLLFLLTFSSLIGVGSLAMAQSVSGTPTTTGCSGGGTITASSTGITTPQYQLLQGTTVVLPDAANPATYTNNPIFSGLASGSYTLKARQSPTSTVYNSATITVANGYTAMTVATPTKVVSCATGTIDLITTITGGKANYTYSISLQGAPVGSPPIKTSGPITATTYIFNAMPIGNYLVSVTDNCGNTVTGATNVSLATVSITNIKPYSTAYLLPNGGVGICSSPLAMVVEGGWVYASGGANVSSADAALFTWKIKYQGVLYGKDVTGDGYSDATGGGIPLTSSKMIMPIIATRAGIIADYPNMKIVVSDLCGNTKEFAVWDYNGGSSSVTSAGGCSGTPIIKAFLGAGMACLPLDITFTNSTNPADKVTFNVTSGSTSFLGTGLTPGKTYNLTYLDASGYTTNVYKTTSITIPLTSSLSVAQYPLNVNQYNLNLLGYAQANITISPALPTDLISYTVTSSDNPSIPVGYNSSKLYGNPSGGIFLNPIKASDPQYCWPKGNYVLDVTTPCGVVKGVKLTIGGYTASLNGYTTTPICGGFNYVMNGTFGDGLAGNLYSAFEVVMLSPGGGTQKRDMANATSSLSFDGLTPGTYVFALRIKGGTTNVLTQTVVYNAASVITVDKANTGGFVCTAGSTNGILTITASSASPGTGSVLQYAISLDGGTTYSAYQSSNTFPNLPSGIYSFKVKDGCNNEITNTAQIGVAATPTATANGLASTAQVCKTVGGTMSLDVDVAGTGVTYTWSGPGISNTVGDPAYKGLKSPVISLDGLTAGLQNYSVSVLNAACSATPAVSNLTVNINALPTATIVYPTVICQSDAAKSVALTGQTGGTYAALPAGLTINATTGAVTPSTSTAGTYTVTYSFTNGTCTNTTTTSVTINALPTAPTVSTTAASCSAIGTATVSNYVSTNTYTFLPTGPTVGAGGAITGMVAGTSYTVTTNNGSCTSAASASFSIAAMLPAPAAPTVSTTVATCSAIGTATVSNYILTNTYTFSPTGPTVGAGGAISGMVVGTSYMVTTNNGSCTSSASAPFSIAAMLPAPTAPTVSTTAASCSASGTATVSNYVATNTYAFLPTGPSVGAGGAISGMVAGTSYTLATNNGSCTSAASASFSIAAMLPAPAAPTVSTTAASCSAIGTATVSNYVSTDTYTFSPSGPTVGAGGAISGMTAGTSYTLTTNNGSCTSAASASFSIAAMLPAPTAPTVSTTAASCSAIGTATVSNYVSTNTYTFLPTGPTVGAGGAITGMVAGTSYTVTTNNGSCTSGTSSSFTIGAMLATPGVPTITTTVATCSASGTATISNYVSTNTYAFLPTGPTVGAGGLISGMTAGTSYTVTANNGNCTSGASSGFSTAPRLATPSAPTVLVTAQPVCGTPTGSISITDVTGETYSVDGGAYTATLTYAGLAPGSHTILAKSTAGCISNTTNITISPAKIKANAPTVSVTAQPICGTATGSIAITGVTGETYSIDGGAYTATLTYAGLTPGTHIVKASSTDGCLSTGTDVVIAPAKATAGTPVVSVTAQPTCALATGSISITGATGETYSVDGSAYTSTSTYSGLTPGSHTITAKSADGCISNTANITINAQPATPVATIAYGSAQYQAVGTASVTQTGQTGGSYTASPSGLNISSSTGAINLGASTPNQTYTVTYAFSNGSCTGTATATVRINSTPATIAYAKPSYCATGTAGVIQTGPANGTYTSSSAGLKISGTTGAINLGASTPGSYTVSYTYQDGTVTAEATTSVTVIAMPVVSASSDRGTDISKGDIATLTATGGTSYSWSGADIQSGQNTAVLKVRPRQTTTYTVTAVNAGGCSDVSQITITVTDDFKLEPNNVVTPNGDGKNDTWFIKNLDYYPNNTVGIYDRAGRKVYGASSYKNDWDGSYNGQPLAEGAYIYVIDLGKGIGLIRGTISIIRDNR